MNEEQLRNELERLREENSKLQIELNAYDEENQKLRVKLNSFEKGTQRSVFDIDTLASYSALKDSFYSIQSYGPRGNAELLSKLGHIVRRVLFADETTESYRRPRWRDETLRVDVIPKLKDINDMQYSYYLLALDRIYKALSDTVIEYRDEREEANA